MPLNGSRRQAQTRPNIRPTVIALSQSTFDQWHLRYSGGCPRSHQGSSMSSLSYPNYLGTTCRKLANAPLSPMSRFRQTPKGSVMQLSGCVMRRRVWNRHSFLAPQPSAIPVPSDTARFCHAVAGLCHAPTCLELSLSPGPEPQRFQFRRTPRGSVMQLSCCVMRPRVRNCTSPGP